MTALLLSLALAADPTPREVGNLVFEGVPESPAWLTERLGRYGEIRSASLVGFRADDPANGIYVTTRFGETSQLHRVAEPGAARHQLTFFDEPVRSVVPSPTDPDLVLLSRDVGGSEQYQVWLLNTKTGAARQLSTGPGRATGHSWSPDGTKIGWTQNLEGTSKHLVVVSTDDLDHPEVVFAGEGAWYIADWMPEGKGAVISLYVSAKESELHLLDFASQQTKPINKSRKPISYGDVAVTPDGRFLYATTDMKADRLQLWLLPMDRGRPTLLTEDIPYDVDDIELSPDGSTLAFTVNDEGRSTLYLRDTKEWSARPVPKLPPGVMYGMQFDGDGDTFGFTLNRADAPGDAYSFDLGDSGTPELVRWTESETGGIDPAQFVQPTFFRYPSFDGMEIPAFVYEAEGEGKHPVVIAIHGGPEGQSRPYFSSTYQLWASELGITVVVPNVRGSTGFGRAYHQLDNGLGRKGSVKDIGGLLDWVAQQPDMDADRVVVYGGSYGGYMVLASMIDFSDRLAGGVDIVGISDFETFLTNTKDYRRDLRREEYGDERDPKIAAFFDEISPLKHASEIADHLFVIQGANDPRVPASEARQIVDAVRESGNEAWYLLAMDEGHGFRKKTNRDAMAEAVVLYFQEVMGLDLGPEDSGSE